jgi:hypothetical protein
VKGLASQAGVRHEDGRSAIYEMARQISVDGKGAHAAYEQIYFSSLVPRTYLCARLLETLGRWLRSATY